MVGKKIISNSSGDLSKEDFDDVPPPLPRSVPPKILRSLSREYIAVDCPYASEDHEGKELISVTLNMSAETAFKKLFIETNFMRNIYEERKYYDIDYSPWETLQEQGAYQTRKLSYTAVLPSNALGPSTSDVTEIQTMLTNPQQSKDVYVINTETANSGIPYGDNFRIHIHYCIMNDTSNSVNKQMACKFRYFANIKFKKGTFFVAKNLIQKAVMTGVDAIAQDIQAGLLSQDANGMGVKRKRKSDVKSIPKIKDEESSVKSRWKMLWSWFLLASVIGVAALNVYLYRRISELEEIGYKVHILKMDDLTSPESPELDIKTLIKKQNFALTSYENQFKQSLAESLDAISKAEIALRTLLATLPAYNAQRQEFIDEWEKLLDKNESNHNDSHIPPEINSENVPT